MTGHPAAAACGAVLPVLLYHSVAEDPPAEIARHTVTPRLFAEHVAAIAATGRTPISIHDLATGMRGHRPLPERPVAITFDDGYSDTYVAVASLLESGLAATVYATTGQIDRPGHLSSHQLAELARERAVELGAHTVHHPRLDELSRAEAADEIRISRSQLEQVIQARVDTFAYPHGAYDRDVRQAVALAGYMSAAAVKDAVSHPADDPFAIARWTVTAGTPASRIAEVLDGRFVPPSWARERVRTRGYRFVRRQRRRLARAAPRRAATSW